MKGICYWLVLSIVLAGLGLSACASQKGTGPVAAPERPSVQTPASPAPQLNREQKLIEDAKKEGKVVLWTYTWERPNALEKLFKEKYPFLEFTIWDASRATDAIARQIEEAKVGRYSADLVIYPFVDTTPLREAELLVEYDWPNTKGWTAQPPHNFWRIITVGGRAPVYNTDLLAPAEVPKSWEDLKDARWRGKAMISTSARDIPMTMAYVFGGGKLDWDKSFSFWKEVVDKTKPIVVSGFTQPMERIAAGEVPLFLISALEGSIMNLLYKGAPLGIAPVEAGGAPNAIALMKNAPHPAAAKLLADFFSSEQGLLAYAEVIKGATLTSPEVNKKTRAFQYYQKSGMKMTVLPSELMTPENNLKSSEFWVRGLYGR